MASRNAELATTTGEAPHAYSIRRLRLKMFLCQQYGFSF